jgi:hypothetical protein
MHSIIIKSTLVLLLLSLSPYSRAADKITQETKGDQSPAIIVQQGGKANVNYNHVHNYYVTPAFTEVKQRYSECIQLVADFQRMKLEELDKRLAEYYVQQTGAPNQDAKKWVEDVIRYAPEYKKQMQENDRQREEWNREFSKDILAKTYDLFTYLLDVIDTRFAALQEANPKTIYEKTDKFILFSDASKGDTSYIARTFIMPNGNRIYIVCSVGEISRGLVINCPSLRFSDQQGVGQSFSISPKGAYGTATIGGDVVPLRKKEILQDIKYPSTGEVMLTPEFKARFDSTLKKFLVMVYGN